MILFNSILFSKFGQQFNDSFHFCSWKLYKKYRNFNNKYITKFNIFINDKKILVSNINNDDLLLKEYKKNNFIYRNFWQKLINEYCKETVFLSSANTISQSYINKVKSLNLSIYNNNEYKRFLHKFNKHLANGKINVELNNFKDDRLYFPTQKNNVFLKYTWLKLFSLKSNLLLGHKNKVTNSFPTNMLNISNNILPLFVVINSNQEIVVSESTHKIVASGILSNLYNYFTKLSNLSKKSYTGLLFVNYNDAIEYKNYIQLKYPSSTSQTAIQVVPTTTNLYYHLMMLKDCNIEFRLIPDLKEVSDLIYYYKKYKNVKFNNDQKYGRNFFQGQPLYFIQPLYVKKQGYKNVVKLSYTYNSKNNDFDSKYQPAFLNYNTLMFAWQKFRTDNPNYVLPNKPVISVSNLEAFIKNKKEYKNTIFLPSYQTYCIIKSHLDENVSNKKDLKYWIANKGLYCKTLLIRVFWSLTSRQPINW